MFFAPRCIGRAGASNTRRLILLISVGWVPPYLLPSGACLTLGTRIPDGLVTLSRVTPNRGCASSNARWQLSVFMRSIGLDLANLRCERDLLSNGPHKAHSFTSNGHDHLVGVFPSCQQAAVACAQ